MPSSKRHTGCAGAIILPLLLLALTDSPLVAGAFTASGKIEQFFSGGGNPEPGIGTNSATGASWVQGFDNGAGLEARNFAIANQGLLSVFATVNLNWPGWASGSITSSASGAIAERIWRASDSWPFETSSVMMTFGFMASGSVSAFSDSGDTSGSGISYQAAIGNDRASGSRTRSSDGTTSETGDWGLAFIRTILYQNSDMYLFLEGRAYAGAGKTYLAFPVTGATGDFSHTLRWGGVSKVETINPDGSFTEIPGAYVPMTGDLSGFNYFYAAPTVGADVPEPSCVFLLGAGLIATGWRCRARLRRRAERN